jgi:hypothetical protein
MGIIHQKYLPFSEEQLFSHFAHVGAGREAERKKYLGYYRRSAENYKTYCQANPDRKEKTLRETKVPCQIEKDERFWTAACMMTIFYSRNRAGELIKLLKLAYGDHPPVEGIECWEECCSGDLALFFETQFPSPHSYKVWLSKNLITRQFIPYILDSARDKPNLEGPTHVDALLLNSQNGFAVVFEAKVLSDISVEITYDLMRNQLARNIDVMLEKNDSLNYPLNKRIPERTLFLLVTPRLFRDDPTSRLYGYKFMEYKKDPNALARDLPQRTNCNWGNVTQKLGWLTWEDFRSVNKDCCRWLM